MDRLRASVQVPLEELLTRITSSHIERRKGFITLFMCSISPSCRIPELLLNPSASRIEIDIEKGKVKVWLYEHKPKKPDVLITGVLLCVKDMSLS
jgi:hypothetical protein